MKPRKKTTTQYRTIDISTVAGQAQADRLARNGWTVVRPGLFTVVLRKVANS